MQHIVIILTKAQLRAPRSRSANVHVFMARVRALIKISTRLISNQSAMFCIVHVPKMQIATITQLFAASDEP